MPQQGGGPRWLRAVHWSSRDETEQGEREFLFALRKFLFLKKSHDLKSQTQQYEYLFILKVASPLPPRHSALPSVVAFSTTHCMDARPCIQICFTFLCLSNPPPELFLNRTCVGGRSSGNLQMENKRKNCRDGGSKVWSFLCFTFHFAERNLSLFQTGNNSPPPKKELR